MEIELVNSYNLTGYISNNERCGGGSLTRFQFMPDEVEKIHLFQGHESFEIKYNF